MHDADAKRTVLLFIYFIVFIIILICDKKGGKSHVHVHKLFLFLFSSDDDADEERWVERRSSRPAPNVAGENYFTFFSFITKRKYIQYSGSL